MKVDFFNRIRRLPKGTLRLYTVISLSIPIMSLLFSILINGLNGNFFEILDRLFEFFFFAGFFLFWIALRVFLWVKDGYKDEEKVAE